MIAATALVAEVPESAAAVALCRGHFDLHCGMLYRSEGTPWLLHLAFHHRLEVKDGFDGWMFVVPTIDPIDLQIVAAHCTAIVAAKPDIAYGLAYATSSRWNEDGSYVPGPGQTGLTCSTFVLSIFDWARVDPAPLNLGDWQQRPGDREIQVEIVNLLRGRASPEHLAAVEREMDSVRLRPEEIAAASGAEGRPLQFADGQADGATIRTEFYRQRPDGE